MLADAVGRAELTFVLLAGVVAVLLEGALSELFVVAGLAETFVELEGVAVVFAGRAVVVGVLDVALELEGRAAVVAGLEVAVVVAGLLVVVVAGLEVEVVVAGLLVVVVGREVACCAF